MAYFFAPDRRADGYDLDGRSAPDSVWRMRIPRGQARPIGLRGGQGLSVRSTNPSVVPNDGFGEIETRADGLRIFKLSGLQTGTCALEARLGAALQCALQVAVAEADPALDGSGDLSPWPVNDPNVPISGSMPAAARGAALLSVVRIPVPGTMGLAVELSPRGWTPQGGSTSTLFIQDIEGKRFLRLDYGFNAKTNTLDYHWNRSQKPPVRGLNGQQNPHPFNNKARFDHANPGAAGRGMYWAAKYLKWGGRVLLVVGVTVDVISIVQANKPLRQASQVVTGWALAWAGCQVGGRVGAFAGTLAEPGLGTAVGAIGGCVIGGALGYTAGSGVAGDVYDWAEDTYFAPLPEVAAP